MNDINISNKIKQLIFEVIEPETSFSTPIANDKIRFYDFVRSDLAEKYGFLGAEEFEAESTLTVHWSLIIHSNKTGISSLDIVMKNVTGNIHVILNPFSRKHELDVPFNAVDSGFEIKSEIPLKNGAAIFPDEMEISFVNKEIAIN